MSPDRLVNTKNRSNRRVLRRSACFATPTVALCAMTGVAMGGLVGGPTTHTWTGNVSTSWNNSANWNTLAVPVAGDSVIVNSGPNNALLNSNTPALRSLFVGGSRSVSNNGFVLTVTDTIASTTVNGLDSTLFITNTAAPFGFTTDTLEIENNGRLLLTGGWALVNDQVTLSSGGRITGNGYLDINSASPAAFNGVGGELFANGGTLHIRVFNGGTLAMPSTINATSAGSGVSLFGPLMLAVNDINLGPDALFASSENWTLGGTLTANPGAGNASRVQGDGSVSVEGDVVVTASGELQFLTPVNFESTSTTLINSGATMEMTEIFTVDAGHATTISVNGRMLLNGPISSGGWDGTILSNAGIIESNSAFGLRIDGEITLGSWGGLRTRINGTSHVTLAGDAISPGLGAEINGTFDLSASSTYELGDNATVFVNGDMIARTDATLFGGGKIQVQTGGELTVQQDANFGVDIVNGGDLRVGSFSNQNVIDINGTFDQSATGRLLIDIGGLGDTQRDMVQVHDDVSLDGTLHIALTGGFTPTIGDEFEVLSANNVSGAFASLSGAPGFNVQYSPDSVTLVYVGVGLLGDVNNDGVVNVADLLMVIANWGAAAPNPADANGDGTVNVADLLLVIANWG